jgi:ferredoxin-NADP reductase
LAGGSGITPVISIARSVLLVDASSRLSLIYANRSSDDVIFAQALEQLGEQNPDRFETVLVLESAPATFAGLRGRLDRNVAQAALDRVWPTGLPKEYFVCGPEPMMAEVRQALTARGVAPEAIQEERFVTARSCNDPLPSGAQTLVVRMGARQHTVTVKPGQTLLEAALAAGLPLRFSCTVGGCGTCKVKRSMGRVCMDEPNALTESERQQGYILACIARPLGPTTVEVPS